MPNLTDIKIPITGSQALTPSEIPVQGVGATPVLPGSMPELELSRGRKQSSIRPFNNSIDGNSRKVEIGRTTQGYYIKDISGLTYPDGSVHYGQFGYNAIPNSLYTINGITTNNIQYYDTINEALRPISEYVLTQYGILLDMQEAAEAIQNNRINNANIGY